MYKSKCDRLRSPGGRGFTAVELLVVLGIVVILLSIFIPYLLSIRETSNRSWCADKLRQIRDAMQAYANDNEHNYPRVRYDAVNFPNGYAAFTGADDPDPFAPSSAVHPSDVTASLWLLVRGAYVTDTRVFVCPSAGDRRDRLTSEAGPAVSPKQRGNFRSPANLSYSYASPFSSEAGYRLNSDWLKPQFALLADKNPGRSGDDDVTAPTHDAPPRELARANSRNHDKAGQNVLFGSGEVAFVSTPFCGFDKDNIYTALAAAPLQRGQTPSPVGPGYIGLNLSPVHYQDSFLVPLRSDAAPSRPDPAPPTTTTAPSTFPATQPATTTGS